MSEKYDGVKKSKKEIFFNNIIGGIGWAIGATLGLSLLVAFLGLIGHYVNLVPLVGNFVSEIINYVINKNMHPLSSLMPFLFSQYAFA